MVRVVRRQRPTRQASRVVQREDLRRGDGGEAGGRAARVEDVDGVLAAREGRAVGLYVGEEIHVAARRIEAWWVKGEQPANSRLFIK